MLRVGDLERSIQWYEQVLGMRLLRTRDASDQGYRLAFMAYGDEDASTVVELTENKGVKEYARGDAYAQIAVSTRDVYKTAEAARAAGGSVTREPGPVPGIGTKITAVVDPDGWKTVFVDADDFALELVQAAKAK
jgi:lactoylglutathione lyase